MDAGGASDEGACCGRPSRVVPTPRRRCQVRVKAARATVSKKPGHRGDHGAAVKTIAWGTSGDPAEPVATTLVCFFTFAREAAGAACARCSPCPLSKGQNGLAKLGRMAPREREGASSSRQPRSNLTIPPDKIIIRVQTAAKHGKRTANVRLGRFRMGQACNSSSGGKLFARNLMTRRSLLASAALLITTAGVHARVVTKVLPWTPNEAYPVAPVRPGRLSVLHAGRSAPWSMPSSIA